VKLLIRFPHGLGDVVQAGVLLKYLRKYRSGWQVHCRVGRGKHTAIRGLCQHVFHDDEPDQKDSDYDTVLSLGFYENYCRYPDRPNTKITNCLREVFGLDWSPDDAALNRYEVRVSPAALHRATLWLAAAGCTGKGNKFNSVVIHYEGNTSPAKKNLGHWQVLPLVDLIVKAGRVPVLLDWDRRSVLLSDPRVKNPGTQAKELWGDFGSGDAETIAALITLSEAYMGVDSGPGKIASATETPSLICWRGHHPIQFHDPAPNTVHLIPQMHRELPPVAGHPPVIMFFESNYRFITYQSEHDLINQAAGWIRDTLSFRGRASVMDSIVFALPSGIGDVAWALTKIRSIAAGRPIEVVLAGDPREEVNHRAVPFLKRFPFVEKVTVADVPILYSREEPNDSRGRYRYLSDGERAGMYYLVPNAVLEAGRRLEEWLPEHPCDWKVFDEFCWVGTERAQELALAMDPFVVFYLGPERGHTDEGHNRGWLWEPSHWVELGRAMHERGMSVCVVGASYDRSFWEKYVKNGVEHNGQAWVDLIGKLEIGETFKLLKRARCVFAYQSGLAICNVYFGGRTVSWWRPDGNSAHPDRLVSFDERMAASWVPPGREGNYLGCIYGREAVSDIVAEVDRRGWLR
jgi:Glycosyltransferase family 9 (heptosyltransferase)